MLGGIVSFDEPGSTSLNIMEKKTELCIKKEIPEAISFLTIKAEPGESSSNEIQPIDEVRLQSYVVHLYFCSVCNGSFTDNLIRTN